MHCVHKKSEYVSRFECVYLAVWYSMAQVLSTSMLRFTRTCVREQLLWCDVFSSSASFPVNCSWLCSEPWKKGDGSIETMTSSADEHSNKLLFTSNISTLYNRCAKCIHYVLVRSNRTKYTHTRPPEKRNIVRPVAIFCPVNSKKSTSVWTLETVHLLDWRRSSSISTRSFSQCELQWISN